MKIKLTGATTVAIDFETRGGVSLDAEAVSVGLAFDNGQSYFLAWDHESGNNCSIETVRLIFADIEMRGMKKVFHNAQFDIRVAYNAGILITLNNIEDTMTLAPLLNENEPSYKLDHLTKKYLKKQKLTDEPLIQWCAKQFGGRPEHKQQVENFWRAPGSMVKQYCLTDANITLELYQYFRPKIDEEGLSKIYEIETKQIPILMRMHWTGVNVDIRKARRVRKELQKELESKQHYWDTRALVPSKKRNGPPLVPANPNSPIDMGMIFDQQGIPYALSPKSKKPVIRKARLQEIADTTHNPLIKSALEIRQLEKIISTFIDGYILNNATEDYNIIHGEFHPLRSDEYGTVSGRYSSGGHLNLQNLPSKRHAFGNLIRSLFVAPPGTHWVKIDYSQIEYRFFAHYAGGQLRRSYQKYPNIDFHDMVADMTGLHRDDAKNINFGILYGMGKELLARAIGRSVEEASVVLDGYHRKIPEAKMLYNKAMRKAQNRGEIYTWQGRKRRFERYFDKDEHRWKDKCHTALNALLQGSAADLIKCAMIDVYEVLDWEENAMRLTVHDELDITIEKGAKGDRLLKDIKDIMESYKLTVPIIAEVERGSNWGLYSPENKNGLKKMELKNGKWSVKPDKGS